MSDHDKNKSEGKLLDHSYDGIQELDNPLPRWWVYMFVCTFVFGLLYWMYYTIGGGPSLVEEFNTRVLEQSAVATAPKESHNPADFKDDSEHRNAGQKVYETSCMACHAQGGAGLIGPNLTDKHWIHGKGTIEDLYKVVSEGVADKGMPAWGAMLKAEDVENAVVYVKSLQGSSPANPKAPQGVLVE